MPTLVQIDESSGTQNGLIAGVTTNDIDILSGGIAFPTEFSTALAAVTGGQGIPSVAALSGFGTATTDDDFIPVTFGANVSDVAFTLTGGNGVDSTLMTTNGTKIFLYVYSGNNNVVLGRLGTAGGLADPSGAIAFAGYLDTQTPEVDSDVGATAARLWLIQYLALKHPDGTNANDVVTLSGLLNVQVNNVLNFSLEGAPSGNNLFLMYGDGTPSLTDTTIVVTGQHPANQSGADPVSTADDISITTGDTVNTGQGGGGTTLGNSSQMVNPLAGLIFTFVTGANPDFTVSKTAPNLDQNEADIEANIAFTALVPSTGATFAVVQLQQDSLAELQISASNTDLETGTSYIDGLGDADDLLVTINYIKVSTFTKQGQNLVAGPTHVFTASGSDTGPGGTGVTATFNADGTVKLVGLEANDKIEYHTAGTHTRVLIKNTGDPVANASQTNAAFDIGGFQVTTGSVTGTPLDVLAFVDDGPTASAVLAAGTVAHDETAGVDADADDTTDAGVAALFAGVTTLSTQMTAGFAQGGASVIDSSASAGGADGLASTSYSLAVSAAGVDSGLDTVGGQNILLYKEGDLVVGRISGGADDGEAAFAVAINSSTGVLSVAQYNAIKHPTTDPDESLSIANAALLAVATATDGDTDTNAASVAIGAAVSFQDDGPSASAVLGAGTVAHDETAGVDADADDTTDAGVAALFAGVTTLSTQMTAGFAQGDASVIDSSASAGGADGLASTVYSLAVSAAGVDSGLDTVGGQNILLYKEGDLVVGRISGGADDGEAAFAVAINSSTGVLSVAQYNAIKHPTGGANSPDESLSIANAALLAVATATDGDTDTNAASVAIGAAVSFQDDGPSASAVLGAGTVAHDETAGVDADADDTTDAGVAALFAGVTTLSTQMTAGFAQGDASVVDSSASTGGADGLASTSYSLAVSAAGVDSGLDTVGGQNILLYKEGDLVVGRISGGADDGEAAFAVAINSSTGVLSVAQYNAIKHPTTDPDESLSIAGAALLAVTTVTDGDTDTDTESVGIGAAVSFQDDGPTAAAALGAGTVAHDETAGEQADADDTTDAGVAALFAGVTTLSTQMAAGYAQGSASVVDSSASTGGADGLASTVYSLAVSAAGVDSGLDTVGGQDILLFKEGDLVVGRISGGADDGEAAFAVAINSSTGVLSVAQYNAIKHPTGGASSYDESLSIANAALLAVATVTDGDTDTNAASVGIGAAVSFQDDGPSASAVLGAGTVAHDETAGVQADANDTTAAGVVALFAGVTTLSTQMTAGYAQGIASVIDSSGSTGGADGLASTVYSLAVSAAGVDSGLDTVGGQNILLYKEGDLVVGRISGGADDGEAAFAVAINSSTGVLSVAQYNAIKHPTGGASSPDESLSITNAALLAVATATDGDTDTNAASVAIGAAVSFQDDGPSLAFGNLIGTGTINPQYGYWNMSAGVDGLATNAVVSLDRLNISLDTFQLVKPDSSVVSGTSFTFSETAPSPDGSDAYHWTGALTGDFDNNAATVDTVEHFTMTALANGTYAIDLVEGFGSTITTTTAGGTLSAGGPDPSQTLTLVGGVEQVVFFAVDPTAATSGIGSAIQLGAPDRNEPTLQQMSSMADWDEISSNGNQPGDGTFPFISDTYAMNVSTSGIGVNNNVLNGNDTVGIQAVGDESFVVNPQTLLTAVKVFIDNSNGGYDTATEDLYYLTYYDDGSVGALTEVNSVTAEAGGQVSFTVLREGSKLIDAVQLLMGRGAIKIPVLQFTTETNNLADGIKLTFTANIADGDADTASSSFVTNLAANALGANFDFVLNGVASKADAFDVDLAPTLNKYQVNGFELGADKLVLLGANSYALDTSTADTVVDITETAGGQHTFVTVMGVDLTAADIATIV